MKVVILGAGAAGVACGDMLVASGFPKRNILMLDRAGVIYKGRTEHMNPYKEAWANDTKDRTLADAMRGADIFLGLSGPDLVSEEMVKSMAPNPIIFAMANPDPEITPQEVASVRSDAIMATGRSDFPNQVNNCLGFPGLFRGALDVRARKINEPMKLAAVHALADLAKLGEKDIPEAVKKAYPKERFHFGPSYIIPKPFDPRVLLHVAPAVAKAAMDSGVARLKIDLGEYRKQLEQTSRKLAKS